MKSHFDPDLIRAYDVNGPRYTSYPTANLFSEDLADDAFGEVESEATVESDTHDPNVSNNDSVASTKIMYPPVFLPIIVRN